MIATRRDHFQATHLLGVLHYQRGDFDEADRFLRRALRIKSTDSSAHYHRGMVLAALHRTDKAVRSFDNAIALEPSNAAAHNNRGVALLDLKRYDEAIASFGSAIALQPDFAEPISIAVTRSRNSAYSRTRSQTTTRPSPSTRA